MAISTLPLAKLEWEKNSSVLRTAFEYVDMRLDVEDTPGAVDRGQVRGRIEFAAVSFRYSSRTESALHDVSFRAEPGQFIALVGPSGSGKSTVVDLLLRYYDPISGSIRVDGTDVRDTTLVSLRGNIALVPQETFLFNDTVRVNLLFGSEDSSEEDMVEAARAAQIHDFVLSLPQGYDTLLGERGAKLSGGQKQRISIARALLRRAPVLILDEATSFVDAVTEVEVQRALASLTGKCTIVAIAHRLSTIAGADRIYVFDQGRIVEEGTHQDLPRQGGLYARLLAAQMGSTKGGDGP